MDATKTETLRGARLERRNQIRGQVGQMGDEIQALGVDQGLEQGTLSNHVADDAGMVFESERLATISDDLRDVLAQVDAALGRLDDGTFGTCQRCGQPIGEERLEAFPHVAFCIDCQQQVEREAALRTGV